MYALVRSQPVQALMLTQVPAMAAALVFAELFYKFRSFTLEAVAFLVTWFVLDLAISTAVRYLSGRYTGPPATG